MLKPFNKTNRRMKKEMEKRAKREKKSKRLTLKSAKELIEGWTDEEKQENEKWINKQIKTELKEYCDAVVNRDDLNENQATLLRLLFSEKMLDMEKMPLPNKMMLFQVQMIGEKRRKGKIVVRGAEMLVMADTSLEYIVIPLMEEFYKEIRRDNQEKIDRIKQLNKRIEGELNNYKKIKDRLEKLRNRSVFHRDGFLGTGDGLKEIAELEKKLKELNNENEHHVNIKF